MLLFLWVSGSIVYIVIELSYVLSLSLIPRDVLGLWLVRFNWYVGCSCNRPSDWLTYYGLNWIDVDVLWLGLKVLMIGY